MDLTRFPQTSPSQDDVLRHGDCPGPASDVVPLEESAAWLPGQGQQDQPQRNLSGGSVPSIHVLTSAVRPAPGVCPVGMSGGGGGGGSGSEHVLLGRACSPDDAAADADGSRLGPRKCPSCSEHSSQMVPAGATQDGGSRAPSCWCPATSPPQTPAARVRNQALMRIFGVSPGPTPRPPPLGTVSWGGEGPCTPTRGGTLPTRMEARGFTGSW